MELTESPRIEHNGYRTVGKVTSGRINVKVLVPACPPFHSLFIANRNNYPVKEFSSGGSGNSFDF
jgi:hypothetical protein